MPDMQFFKSVSLILCDLFGYRVDLTPKQFFQEGYAERKLILLLDLYDILKNVRKTIKVNDKLAMAQEPGQSGAVHASDESMKRYAVVNHQEQTQKSMLFKINTEMQRRQLTVVEQFQVQDPTSEASQRNAQVPGNEAEYVPLRQATHMVVGAGISNAMPMGRYTQTITSQGYP